MSLDPIVRYAADKTNFMTVGDYIDFCKRYMDFLDGGGLQANIVSQNEQQYRFFQYKTDGHFNITRPINSDLFINANEVDDIRRDLVKTIKAGPAVESDDIASREMLRRGIYTLQQCIARHWMHYQQANPIRHAKSTAIFSSVSSGS